MRSKLLTAVTAVVLATVVVVGPAPAAPTTAEATTPSLTDVVAVATGDVHTCALLRNHRVRCWGDNSYGGLGDGSTTPRNRAILVRNAAGTGPLSGVTAITVGSFHTCALLTSGQVRCWGDNFSGQLGSGSTALQSPLPTTVANESGESALQGVVQVTAGEHHTCARLASAQVRCWGGNQFHQLGNGSDADSGLPVAVAPVSGGGVLNGVNQIDAGENHTCARSSSRRTLCWGSNSHGELGDGTDDDHLRPVEVVTPDGSGVLSEVRRVSAGGTISCVVLVDRSARCWGDGQYGQLGNGGDDGSFRPVVVRTRAGGPRLVGIGTIDAGYGHACVRLTNGQVRCWGQNEDSELGNGVLDGPDVPFPTTVRAMSGSGPLTGVAQLETNAIHTCVRLANSQVRCWGFGADGQLGDGANANRPRPVRVLISTGAG
jgi:alpha-tubulin suppressor-like RCC1 family protein